MISGIYVLILVLGVMSYIAGVSQMLRNKYKPSVFSRAVWLVLAIISFAGVVASNGSDSSVLLAVIFLAGNIAMCVVSLWKGSKDFGKVEIICLCLLVVNGVVWFVFNAPLVSLVMSLFTHFIGAIPTYKRVLMKPESESTAFWFFFFAASAMSVVASWGSSLDSIVFPVYFTLFEGSLFLLSLTKLRKHFFK